MTGINTAGVCGYLLFHADIMANIRIYYAEIISRLDLVVKTLSEVY
ncbi:MAG: hypothetical protein UW96_C0016G0003 [Candidatus Collierbacteria bacterium GW2011_GWA1_45_15]|nr:MAG: hypothetical protein UW96_C0016G0003 [Candidatus Collierbacteria bacterium GW2011_GWA1_45_15]